VGALGTEIIGGAIGGIIVVIAAAMLPWAFHKFGRFDLRFLDPSETVTPEGMKRSIGIGIPVGESVINLSLRPRMGIKLHRIVFSFFDNRNYPMRLWPPVTGRRHPTTQIKVVSLRERQNDGTWIEHSSEPRADEAVAFEFEQEFSEGSRRVFEIKLLATESMKEWNGILGTQIHYYHSGNLAMRNVNAKVFVKEPTRRRPITFILRGVQRAKFTN